MIFDLVIIAALLISAVIAFLRGFIREVLTILGVGGGLVAAWMGGASFAVTVRGWMGVDGEDSPEKLFDLLPYDLLADILAYVSIFIVVVIVLSIVSHYLAGWARAIGLGAIDRTLGVIFGLVRGILILGLLYLPVYLLVDEETRNSWFAGSKTHYYVAATADGMAAFLPEATREDLEARGGEAAESAARATRERLQDIDLLGGRDDDARDNAAPVTEDESDAAGYQREERQELNRIFQDNLNE